MSDELKTVKDYESLVNENWPDERPEVHRAMVCLLAAAGDVGPSVIRLAVFTGYDQREIAQLSRNWRKSKIWQREKIKHSGWFDEEGGGIAFLMDTMVGMGSLERVPGQDK